MRPSELWVSDPLVWGVYDLGIFGGAFVVEILG